MVILKNGVAEKGGERERLMGRVTIYLDDESEKRFRAAAKAAGMLVIRWVARFVEEKTRVVWPESLKGERGRTRRGGWERGAGSDPRNCLKALQNPVEYQPAFGLKAPF